MNQLKQYATELFAGTDFVVRYFRPQQIQIVGLGGINYTVVTFGELFDTWDFQSRFRQCRNAESVKRSLRRIKSGQMRLDLAK